MACQIRLDWFSPSTGVIDLKTCDTIDYFSADARRFGYLHQLAFYRAVLKAATGQTHRAHFIAVEKSEPYRAAVWRIDEGALDFAQRENEAAIERLKTCRRVNDWPTGYETPLVFDAI